jgi:WD40 repeat protein/serine/threonine protein kinase
MNINTANGDSFYAEINVACERFESELRSGGQPQIRQYVEGIPEGARSELIRELLKLEIYYRRERGDTILPGDYAAFPEHASLVETLLGRALASDRPTAETCAGRYRLEDLIGRGGMGEVYRAHDPEFQRPLAVKILKEEYKDHSDMVARFLEEAKITGQLQHPGIPPVHEIGRLPDGRPFLAMKLIEGRTLGDILAERKTVGQVSNLPEEQKAGWKPAPQDLPRFLAISEQICQTVAYAHSRRIIHRDLKPLNIMVGAFGEVQVMDWGLAKALVPADVPNQPADALNENTLAPLPETVVNPTRPGAIMGTLAYMPPEQARGEVDRLDERSDVFSLGAMLCEFLTGEPPYRERSPEKSLEQAKNADLADAFSRLDACGADTELVTLAKRCLAAEMNLRPGDAGVVAVAVADYEESVEKRLRRAELDRTAADVKVMESRKRRRVAVALGSLVVLVLLIGLAATLSQYQRIVEKSDDLVKEIGLKEVALVKASHAEGVANAKAESEKQARIAETQAKQEETKARLAETAAKNEAQHRLTLARHSAMTAQLSRLSGICERDPNQARELLEDCELFPLDLRDFTWGLYYRMCAREAATLPLGGSCLAFSPDGKLLAVGSQANVVGKLIGKVTVADWSTGQERVTLQCSDQTVQALAFSPDGLTLAVAVGYERGSHHPGKIELWEVATGNRQATLVGHKGGIRAIAFGPEGKTLASASRQGIGGLPSELKLWDLTLNKELPPFLGFSEPVNSILFTADGKTLVSASGQEVRLWGTSTRETKKILKSDGKGHIFRAMKQHKQEDPGFQADQPTPEPDQPPPPPASVTGLAITGDGVTLASLQGNQVTLWDLASGRVKARLIQENTLNIGCMAFSPDGTTLVTASQADLRIWDAVSFQERAVLTGKFQNVPVSSVVFRPDSKMLAWTSGNELKLWDMGIGSSLIALEGKKNSKRHMMVQYRPDGNLIALGAEYGDTIEIWFHDVSARKAEQLRCFGELWTLSPDGNTLATTGSQGAGWIGEVQLWDLREKKKEPRSFKVHKYKPDLWIDKITGMAFSADGKLLATNSVHRDPSADTPRDWKDELIIWDVGTGNQLRIFRRPHSWSGPRTLAFSSDGKALADSTGLIYEIDSGKELATFPGQGDRPMAFSCDGTILAFIDGKTITLLDVRTGKQRASVRAASQGVGCMAFSPDGTQLATGSDKGVTLWDPVGGQERSTFKISDGQVISLAFSPNGKQLATGSDDGTVRLWEPAYPLERVTLKECRGPVAFSVDGKTLYAQGSVGRDPVMKKWDVATGQVQAGAVLHADSNFSALARSADGKLLASAHGAGERFGAIEIWDLAFKFYVFKRYGPRCVVCGVTVAEMLDAAHICPKLAEGSDDPRNGLVLCANHHRAFDAGLFAINPSTLEINCRPDGPDRMALGMICTSIAHLLKPPHSVALSWLWTEWKRSITS